MLSNKPCLSSPPYLIYSVLQEQRNEVNSMDFTLTPEDAQLYRTADARPSHEPPKKDAFGDYVDTYNPRLGIPPKYRGPASVKPDDLYKDDRRCHSSPNQLLTIEVHHKYFNFYIHIYINIHDNQSLY